MEEFAEIYDGTHSTPEYQSEGIKFVSVENINDLYNTNKYISEEAYKAYKIKPRKNDVFMTRIGSIGVCNVVDRDDDLAYYVSLALIRPDNNVVNSRYLKYIIESGIGKKELDKRTLFHAVPIKINKNDIGKIVLPIPTLDVQERVVNVLDNFDAICSDLKIGLPAEIEARQKQYEYYRDKLLNFDKFAGGGYDLSDTNLIKLLQYVFGYVMLPISAISTNLDSKRKPITASDRISGNIPYYGASGIVDYVSDYIFDGDYLLISEDGANLLARTTPIAFSISGKNWVNNHAHIIAFDNFVTQKYVEYYFNSIDLSPYLSNSTMPKLTQQNLNNIKIPVPSYKRQKIIVEILNKFDTLINDLTNGIPAEIEARQKQYEYYRDKLLTFKEKN